MKKYILIFISFVFISSSSQAQEIQPNFARLIFDGKTNIASMNIDFTVVDDAGDMDSSPLIRSAIKVGNFRALDRTPRGPFPSIEFDKPKWMAQMVRPAVNSNRGQCPAIFVDADPTPLTPVGFTCPDREPADAHPMKRCDYLLTVRYEGSPAQSCVQALRGVDLTSLTLIVETQAISQDGTPGGVRKTFYALQPAINDDGPT